MKTLYIISKGMDKLSDEELIRLENEDLIPRIKFLDEAISSEILDERYLRERTPYLRRKLYSVIPVEYAQLIEALFIYKKYDVIYSQTDKTGLMLALVMKYLRIKVPHVIAVSRITSVDEKKAEQKKWFMSKTKDTVSLYLMWSSMQKRIGVESLDIPDKKIKLVKYGVDQEFWKPMDTETDLICSVGMEARDYPTLVEAMIPLNNIPCHIATGESRGELFETVKNLYNIENIPDHITIGGVPPWELRDLYARSRFVVVPLIPTDSDNGLTTILEAMAMGKTVICSKAEGQIDVIEDQVTGIYVPVGDPEALRKAIVDLWNDPEKCERIGNAARQFVVEVHNLEQFAATIRESLEDSIQEYKRENAYAMRKYKVQL